MKAGRSYTFEFGGEKFAVSQAAPRHDPDIWQVYDSNDEPFAYFDTDAESMATEESARNEVRMVLIMDSLICCICEARTFEADDGLCIPCDLLALDIDELDNWDEEET